ncbi:MAG: aspartate carbamoyltransferase [Nitrososphaerota archaeon]|jgi:aspartate carbamoyltransferase catalytic subunit|nr:aspartate carbamoyltransferase [Nitrososphaerota archaeon]MDG6928188.1 aspartate carbamoyltransferase [Nitrososphaerota archaeon]MDG6930902.1 aspartate carbamoyltransferase [Nitrososphaerota archaeon]MDG6932964.1 aspartate carbamoyltransferase [Nitrososphaerota archaeon]MDG6936299.1 aspartate carbamoyltransferase [Nitrososphaerota archaeon]
MERIKDVISAIDLDRSNVELILSEAEIFQKQLEGKRCLHIADDRIVMTVFLEPSTRTRLSFQFAATYLGARAMDFGATEISSIQKGETFEDTIRMVDGYDPDVIVLRQGVPGNAKIAADISRAPVINAGDGANEHPTQALTDIYTIKRETGKVSGLTVGIMGDLKHGRTVSSLSYMLDKFGGNTVIYIAPEELQVRQEVVSKLSKLRYEKADSVEGVMEDIDILYVTRIQKERFSDPTEYERLKGSYVISRNFLEKFKKRPLIMHPLPRVDELTNDVDSMKEAKYFEQARNGVYVRMALLKEVMDL